MNYLDIIIIIVLVWGFYSGFKKGVVYMLISLLAIVVGIYAAIHFSYLLVGKLGEFIGKDPDQLKIVSYILTFVIVFGLMHLIGKILDKFLDAIALGFLNRLAGGALSVAIKVVVLSLALWLFDQGNQMFPIVKQETLNASVLYNPIKNLSPVILVNLKKLQHNEMLKELKEEHFNTNSLQQSQDTIPQQQDTVPQQ